MLGNANANAKQCEEAFGLRLLAVWRKNIQNSEEGEEETRKIHELLFLLLFLL